MVTPSLTKKMKDSGSFALRSGPKLKELMETWNSALLSKPRLTRRLTQLGDFESVMGSTLSTKTRQAESSELPPRSSRATQGKENSLCV